MALVRAQEDGGREIAHGTIPPGSNCRIRVRPCRVVALRALVSSVSNSAFSGGPEYCGDSFPKHQTLPQSTTSQDVTLDFAEPGDLRYDLFFLASFPRRVCYEPFSCPIAAAVVSALHKSLPVRLWDGFCRVLSYNLISRLVEEASRRGNDRSGRHGFGAVSERWSKAAAVTEEPALARLF